MNLSLLTDQELRQFLEYYEINNPVNVIAQASELLSNVLAQNQAVTEPVADLIISQRIELAPHIYQKKDIESLSGEVLAQFGHVFGLAGDTPNLKERLIRILNFKGMIASDAEPILTVQLIQPNKAIVPKVNWKLPLPSEKLRKKAEKWVTNMPVDITGARAGELILGITNVTKNALFKIESGIVLANRARLSEIWIYPDLYQTFMDKLQMFDFFKNLNYEQRALWLIEHSQQKSIDIAEIKDVTLSILNIGDSNISKLSTEQIRELTSDPHKIWSPMTIRNMFPRKPGSRAVRQTLFFLREYWRIDVTLRQKKSHNGLTINLLTGQVSDGAQVTDDYDIIVVKNVNNNDIGFIVSNNTQPIEETRVYSLILKRFPNNSIEDINHIIESTKNFTPAAYKSLMQKINRFRPKYVKFGDKQFDAGLSFLTSLALLLLNPGSFVPDIQRFVTGMESFCKRLAVTIVEDSYIIPNIQYELVTLLGSAFLIQQVKGWKPTITMIDIWFNIALNSLYSDLRFYYDVSAGMILPDYKLNPSNTNLENISALLTMIRSFSGDIAMTRSIARNNGSFLEPTNTIRPDIMPLEHCVDQHWAPEIGYYYNPEVLDLYPSRINRTYSKLFEDLFIRVTGVNSRKESLVDDDFLRQTRLAQNLTLLSKQSEQLILNTLNIESVSFPFEISSSWIAGMMGAIDISGRPEALVTLKPDDLYQKVAIQKPSRNMKEIQLSDERLEKVLSTADNMLEKGVPLNKSRPPISFFNKSKLIYKHDKYMVNVNNVNYELDNIKNFNVEISHVETVPLTIHNTMMYIGNGIVENASGELELLVKNTSLSTLQRVLTYLSGFKSNVKMNKISRDGSGSELTITKDDTAAFHFLLKLSLIYPLALRKKLYRSIEFEVIFGPLLWSITNYIKIVVAGNINYNGLQWGLIEDETRRSPWVHQTDSLLEMENRNQMGERGHFLWIPVGLGKTWIVLSYLKYLQSINKLPDHVIYTLPDSAIKSIIQEIRYFGFKVELLYPLTTVKVDKDIEPLVNRNCLPRKFHISLIEHDHLRRCPDNLLSVASNSVLIVDEVHLTLNDTQRTSMALQLSHLSQDFIVLTGTPVIDTKIHKLINWLEQIVDFEVNDNNFWVAANSMIAKKINTGVIVHRVEIGAPFTTTEQDEYIKLVSPSHGGINTYTSVQSYQQAAKLSYEAITRGLIYQTLQEIQTGNRVFLIAKDLHHQSELQQLLVQNGVANSDIFLIQRGKSLFLTDESVTSGQTLDYKVVIAPVRLSTGYTVTRMNVMITGVYPVNNAVREQIEGRINRISQKNKEITIKIIHAGILTYTLKHHNDAKNLADVLQTMAKTI